MNSMIIFRRFPSQHGDFADDFYGSSDRKIKIWEEHGLEWSLEHEWNAHQASVWKVEWAHPEFGQILASCSFDRTVSVCEDQGVYLNGNADAAGAGAGTKEDWSNQAQLVDA